MQQSDYLGFGLGLRPPHYQDILNKKNKIDWFEIITEDYLGLGGNPLYYLERIREKFPVVMHGVSLSIGSVDPLDNEYLKKVKQLADRIQPSWISDHLCWTGAQGINLHDLLPLPYTEEAVNHVADRVSRVQDILGQRILLENVSSYITFEHSAMTEWEFLMRIVEKADCFILLDINNIYVSSFNHGFDPLTYLNYISPDRVKQFHLAGHSNFETHIVDTHDHDIVDNVWDLYAEALRRFGSVSTLIERDDNIPPLKELVKELNQARKIAKNILGDKS